MLTGGSHDQRDGQWQRQSPTSSFPLGPVGKHGEVSDEDEVDEEEMAKLRVLKKEREQQLELEQAEGEFRVKLDTNVLQTALMSSQQKEIEETLWDEFDKDPKGEHTTEPEQEGEWGADAEFGEDVAL